VTKVQYFTACTIDGYIADENNSLDWLFEVPHDEDDGYWDKWFPSVGGLAMGATSYEWMLERYGMVARPEQWRQFYGDRPAWVFTHRDLPLLPGVEITLVEGDIARAYEAMAQKLFGANLWLVGGGDLVGRFHDARLLDEVILGMAPVTLGRGAPLLPRRITSKQLTFQTAELVGQRIRIVLSVRRRSEP
jgi:dihydrofolate reductase